MTPVLIGYSINMTPVLIGYSINITCDRYILISFF